MSVAEVGFPPACAYLSVYLHDISKTVLAITELDIEMFHREFWKPIHFWIKRSQIKVTRHKKTVPVWVLHSCECRLLLAIIIIIIIIIIIY